MTVPTCLSICTPLHGGCTAGCGHSGLFEDYFQTLFLMTQSQIKEMDKLDIIPVLQEDLVSTPETGLETLAFILEVKDQTVLMKP